MRELIEGVTRVKWIGKETDYDYELEIHEAGVLVDKENNMWISDGGERFKWVTSEPDSYPKLGEYWEFVDDIESTENPNHTQLASKNEWTDKHYNFNYQLKPIDIEKGFVKLDAYLINKIWRLNAADSTGAAFHCLKTLTRLANEKNSKEREIRALYGQVKRWAEIEGIEL